MFTGDGVGGSGDFLMSALHATGFANIPTSRRPDDGLRLTGAFIGAVVMTVLLRRVSGVTLLERSLVTRRPGYADYVRRTSAFVPRPPKQPGHGTSD